MPDTAGPDAVCHDAGHLGGRVLRVFGSASFFRLWSAQVVSGLGDWIGLIAITAIAARVGGGNSATAVGLVLAARVVPSLFIGPMIGVLADRLDRRRAMVICDLGRGLVLAFLPSVHSIGGLIVASLLLELLTLLWSSAKEASVPNLVDRSFLESANSLSLLAAYGTFPISSAVFALLVKVAQHAGQASGLHALRLSPESLALWFDTGTFLLSALTVSTLAIPPRAGSCEPGGQMTAHRLVQDLREGWRYIVERPVVRAVLLGLACGLAGGGTVVPLGPVFSTTVLHAGPSGFGILLTALGVGVAFGILALTLSHKRVVQESAFVRSVGLGGCCLIAAASTSSLTLASLCIVGLGLCAGSVYVLGFSILQRDVVDELRGRIFAALYSSTRVCLLLALIAAPFLSTGLDGLSHSLLSRSVRPAGWTIHLPGVRLTLWLGGAVILGASWLAHRALVQGSAQVRADRR